MDYLQKSTSEDLRQESAWEEWELEWWSKNLGISKEQLLHPTTNIERISEEKDLHVY